MRIHSFRTAAFVALLCGSLSATEPLTLDDALNKVLATHPELAAAKANVEAEDEAIRFNQWPADPMFGVMYEKNMNFMQQQMGAMTSLSLSQDIEFPARYYYRGQVQKSRVALANEELREARLALRRKVVTTYYQLQANQHIAQLIDAQNDTLRQIARIAESRHAVGAVTQQDEMKAHVEQTLMENERFTVIQEGEALQAKLALLLGDTAFIVGDGLQVPDARLPRNLADAVLANSRRIKKSDVMLQQSSLERKLALFEYAPDFRVSARTMVGANRPDNNFAFTVDLSLPLWFFMRQSSEVSAASARSRAAQYDLEKSKRELLADAQEIATKVRTHQNLINVFSTTMMPQAASTLNASRSAYQAGRASFLELLDSARTVYSVRAAYFRHVAEYVEQLVLLEELTGTSLSSLPFGDL